jgi:hypothetical protein
MTFKQLHILHSVGVQGCNYEFRRTQKDAVLLSTYHVSMKMKGLDKHTKNLSEDAQNSKIRSRTSHHYTTSFGLDIDSSVLTASVLFSEYRCGISQLTFHADSECKNEAKAQIVSC